MDTKKKLITTLMLIGTILAVLFLALQGPKETTSLSEWFRSLAKGLGYTGTQSQFRSDVHLIEYFIVGLALMLFAKANNKPLWLALIAGCAFGLAEETMKTFLPTREFGLMDVIKDFIGMMGSYISVIILKYIHENYKNRWMLE